MSQTASSFKEDLPLEIVFEDEYFIAIDKPAGLLVHRSVIDRRETRFAVQMVRSQTGCRVYPVHRLDKPTSGILLFAKDQRLVAEVSEQFSQNTVVKHYKAIVRGFVPASLTIEHPVKARKNFKDQADSQEPKQAVTEVRPLEHYQIPIQVDRFPQARYSLVGLQPKTGRRHQLRYHLKHIAHPIVGDTSYGKSIHNRFFQSHFGCDRLLLAAVSLTWAHPVTKVSTTIFREPSAGFESALQQLRAYVVATES